MSEKFTPKTEYSSEHREAVPRQAETSHAKLETASQQHERLKDIENIREKIVETSKTAIEISKDQNNNQAPKSSYKHVQSGSQLYSQTLNQNLKKIQKHLPSYQRQFSKLIHKPAVEKISDGIGSSVARPSGLLFAGIFSFVASLAVLTICRYFGYEYNYLIGLASLVGGFAVGLFLETVSKIIKKSRV